jgi:ankyrin repeat protein
MPSLIPPSRASPPASCQLFDLVIHLNWDAVAKHAQEHPEDAAWLDDDWLESPLYCACQHDPSEKAIRALLEAYPPAATLASKNGDLPLHIACYYSANIGVLRALIEHAEFS